MGRHKDAVVGEVGRCQAMEALENNQRQLEPHTLYHGQRMGPVQRQYVFGLSVHLCVRVFVRTLFPGIPVRLAVDL